MPAKLPTGVYPRGGVFQLRIGVPDDIAHLWPTRADGKPATDAYRASLRTSDRTTAITKAHAIIAQYRERFDALRAQSHAPTPVPLTDALADLAVQHHVHQAMRNDDLLRIDPAFRDAVARFAESRGVALDPYDVQLTKAKADLAAGKLDSAIQSVTSTAKELGITVELESTQSRMKLMRVMRGIVTLLQSLVARDAGEPVETPPRPAGATGSKSGQAQTPAKLADVMPEWITRTKPADKTIRACERALALFAEATGDPKLRDITKATGAKFVSFLLDPKQKFRNKTAHNHASYINALLNVAVRLDLIDRNPVDLTFDKAEGAQRREPWTDDELNKMFSNRLFTDHMNEVPHWRGVTPAEGRAMLLLTLHTGARISEIAQLRAQDIQRRGGLTVIRITAEAGTVKTADSERTVPLPDHVLQNEWFAAWLQSVAKLTGPVFPAMHGTVSGPGDVAVKWLRAFRKYAGLPEGGLNGAHRFRHSLRTWLAEASVNTETADAITGHAATGSSGRKVYTAAATLPTMKAALDRVNWPEVSGNQEAARNRNRSGR
ncbi:tyrosine-type recombinase/integrase [Paraburkholderia strydomiana]